MDLKEKRMDYLSAILDKYMKTEPKLELNDIAVLLSVELGPDLTKFLEKYKRENKKDYA